MLRAEVYAAIDKERKFQTEVLWIGSDDRWGKHSIQKWLQFMQHHLTVAASLEGDEALHALRKVTSLGVACFEQHGCPERRL